MAVVNIEIKPIFEQFNASIKKAVSGFRRTGKAAGRLDKAIDKVGLAASAASRRVVIASSSMTRSLGRVRARIRSVGGAFAGLGGTLILGGAIKSANEFEVALASILTLNPQGTEKDFRDLSITLSKLYGKAATDQADAFYTAVSFGYTSIAEAEQLLIVANRFAVAGLTDTNTATDLLAGTIRAFGLDAGDAESVSDSFFETIRLGNIRASDLAAGIGNVSTFAAGLGVDLDSLNASIAVSTAAGIKARQAFTGFRGILASIQKPTEEAAQAASDLGIAFGPDAIRDAGGFVPFMQMVAAAVEGNSGALSVLFPQVESMPVLLAILADEGNLLATTFDDIADATGATTSALVIQQDTTAFKLSQTKQAIAELSISVGTGLQPVILAIAEPLNKFVTAINDLGDEEKTILGVSVGIGVLSIALLALSAPMLAIVAALATLTAAIIYWDDITDFANDTLAIFTDAWDDLSGAEKIVNGFVIALGALGLALVFVSTPILVGIALIASLAAIIYYWDDIVESVTDTWDYLGETLTSFYDDTLVTLSDAWDDFGKSFPLVAEYIGAAVDIMLIPFNLIKNSFDTLISLGGDLSNFFSDLFNDDVTIGDAFTNLADNLYKTFETSFKNLGDIILDPIKAALNVVAGLIEKLINSAITGVNFIPGVDIDKITIPRLQNGGSVEGAGTGTSDSIPALLSNGEFVINAAATAKYQGVLEAINANKYARGGPVGFQAGGLASRSLGSFVGDDGLFDVISAQEWLNTFQLIGKEFNEGSTILTGIRNRLASGIALESDEVQKLIKRLDGLVDSTKEVENVLGDLASNLSQGIVDSLSGESDESLGDVFKRSLRTYFLKQAEESLNDIFNQLFNSFEKGPGGGAGAGGAGGIGGFLSGILGPLFGGIFHDGGVVPGRPGQEVPILAMAGETVVPAGGSGGGGSTTIIINQTINAPTEVGPETRKLMADEAKRAISSNPELVNGANNLQRRRNRTFGGS